MGQQANQQFTDGYQLEEYTIDLKLSLGGSSIVYLAKDAAGKQVSQAEKSGVQRLVKYWKTEDEDGTDTERDLRARVSRGSGKACGNRACDSRNQQLH